MTSVERKPPSSTPISLEIDPVSILSLSKGEIFDTIVHNIECTLSRRQIDPLPWKLTGMSLICDPNRNKKYMQKLQKMQCVQSRICTRVYHSKLLQNDAGCLMTPGRKIVIPGEQHKRLTGVIVCRSIDDLLRMETKTTQNVHFIQYKMLAYERIATREVINGPRLSSSDSKLFKTIFDFELSESSGFPRQLLPVALISFSRENDCDLYVTIANFLQLDEHKSFDKSYLATQTNVEFDRIREEQERQDEIEAEREAAALAKLERRQPLADLSRRSTDTGNSRSTVRPPPPPTPTPKVPPIKIKVPRPLPSPSSVVEKSSKPLPKSAPLNMAQIELKFRCLVKLNRVNLSLYNISNLPTSPQTNKKLKTSPTMINKPSTSSSITIIPNSTIDKSKSLIIKPTHKHSKPLKRLVSPESKKSSNIDVFSTQKPPVTRLPLDEAAALVAKAKAKKVKQSFVEKIGINVKSKRPPLPPQYNCTLPLSRIDLSIYDIILPPTSSNSATTAVPNLNSASTVLPNLDCTTTTISNLDSAITTLPDLDSVTTLLPDLDSTTIALPNLDSTTTILSNLDCATNVLPDLDSATTLLPDSDPATIAVPDLDSTTILPILDSATTILPDLDCATNVLPDLDPATHALPILDCATTVLSNLDCDTSVLPNLDSIPMDISDLEPEAPVTVTAEPEIENIEQFKTPDATEPASVVENELVPDVPQFDKVTESVINMEAEPILTLPTRHPNPIVFSIESPESTTVNVQQSFSGEPIIIVECSDDDDDNEDVNDEKIILSDNRISVLPPPSSKLFRSFDLVPFDHRDSTSSPCSSISTENIINRSPQPMLNPIKVFVQKSRPNHQHPSRQQTTYDRMVSAIPLFAQEPLVDPRLIYRLQSITTNLSWRAPCYRCLLSPRSPDSLDFSTCFVSMDANFSPSSSSSSTTTDYFVDPRREPLRNAILDHIYQRLKKLISRTSSSSSMLNCHELYKLISEQTIFKTNCSLHLENLLRRIRILDDKTFFHLIQFNDDFQLSSLLLNHILV